MRTFVQTLSVAFVAVALTCITMAVGTITPKPMPQAATGRSIEDRLYDATVQIKFEHSWGSGAFRVTNDGQAWIWGCAHVVEEARHETMIDGIKQITFDPIPVRQILTYDGQPTSAVNLTAEVIRYSSKNDLSLLRVCDKDFKPRESLQFYMESRAPPLGSRLVHVGAPDRHGRKIMTTGIMSQHHITIESFPSWYDMVTVPIIPGCSGGPVALATDGRCVGIFVIYNRANSAFTWIVPVRRMRAWAVDVGVSFTMDSTLPIPTDEMLFAHPRDTDEE